MTPVVDLEPVTAATRRPLRLFDGEVVDVATALDLVRAGRGRLLHPESRADLERWVEASMSVIDTLRPVMEAYARVLSDVAASFGEIARRFVADGVVADGVVADEQGDDVAARAFEARRRRNTGPMVHADPRRNRR